MYSHYYRTMPVLLMLVMILISCAHVRIFNSNPQDDGSGIERQSASKSVTIAFKNGAWQNVRFVRFIDDSLFFKEVGGYLQKGVLISNIQSIRIKNKTIGALEGMGIGFLIGAGLGVFAGLTSGDESSGLFSSSEWKATLGGSLGGILGILIGFPIGYGSGSTTIYKFQAPPTEHYDNIDIIKEQ